MGVYTTTKCGICGIAWEQWEYGQHPSIGTPFVKCRHCHGLNKTKQVLYRDSNLFTKISFWSGQIFSNLVQGVFPVVFSFFAFTYEDNSWIIILFGIMALLWGGNNLYHLTKTLDYAKAIEELYDRNGGFLWSDEAY